MNKELMLRYDRVRTFAKLLTNEFDDHGSHYVFKGSMNSVEFLREAVNDLETFMETNNISPPEPQ